MLISTAATLNAMCSKADIRLAIHQHIQSNRLARGLAVVIGNQDSSKPGLKKLDGPPLDVKVMCEAFESLYLATFAVENASRQEMLDIIQGIKEFFPWNNPHYVYQRLVFVFAGHGDKTDSLHTHDGLVDLKSELIAPLLPGNCRQLEHVPKLFFIDACRSEPPKPDPDDSPRPKGGRMPSTANYYLAQSTQWGEIAVEKHDIGGCWMQILARELLDFHNNTGKNIQSIVSQVNRKLHDFLSNDPDNTHQILQQPLDGGTLHEDVFLLDEAVHFAQLYLPPQWPNGQGVWSCGQEVQPWAHVVQPWGMQQRDDTYPPFPGAHQQSAPAPTSAPVHQSHPPPQGQSLTGRGYENKSSGTQAVSPIEELEQYLTEKCENEPVIKYSCSSVGGRYQATVIAPLIGYLKGEVKTSETKAKRSAAQMALRTLREPHE